MLNNYRNAMAICKHYGPPDLFITFTCNPKWPELCRLARMHGGAASDIPAVWVSRCFKIKLDEMLNDFKEWRYFWKS